MVAVHFAQWFQNHFIFVVIVVALLIVALLRFGCWFRAVALAQPPETTSVCLETSELIKNGFGQVGFELNRQGFFPSIYGPFDEIFLIEVVS